MKKEKLEGKNIILWVGDEISAAEPTNLPTKQELFEYTISTSCGEAVLEKIKEKVEQFNEFTIQTDYSSGGNVYPENMIRELGKIKAANMYAGMVSFLKVPYNSYHCYLALLLEQGVSIVTTNYDMCIERAYEFLMGGKDKMKLADRQNGVYIYKGEKEETGTVYHIHGVASHPSDIGANVGMNAGYFSGAFRKNLDCWALEGYQVYFAGYGAKDVYDVTIYLQNRVNQLKKPLWVGHYITTGYRKDLPQRVKILLKVFERNEVIRMTNEDFFMDLCTRTGGLSKRVLKNKVARMMNDSQREESSWKKWVYPQLVKARPYKNIILLRVNQILGVDVEETEPEIYSHLDKMPESSRNMYQSLLFRYRYDSIPPYGYVIRSTEELSHEDKLFEKELVRLCNDTYNIEKKYIRRLSEKAEKVMSEYINALRCNGDGSKWEREAKSLLGTINDLLPVEKKRKKPEKIPTNRHQSDAVLYRLCAAMKAVVAKWEEELELVQKDIGKSYFYSQQTSNQVAFCKTMEFAGFCYLCFYYKSGKKKKSYYNKSQKLKTLQKKLKQ